MFNIKRGGFRLAGTFAAVLLLASALAVGTFAASFTDTQSHWSNTYVEYMVEKEILSGYTDGTFKPDSTVTRAEFIKMIDATFGLTATKSISFSDVKDTDWYYVYIQRAAEQGYLLDYGTNLGPNELLTREEAAALLVRYLDVPDSLMAKESSFNDYSSVSSQYGKYVLKAVGAGLIKGYEDSTFRPKNTLTRAEAMTVLYRAAGTIYQGSKNGVDSTANPANASITVSDVTVSGAKITGNVYITEGATNGTVTFTGCTFKNDVYLRGTVKVVFQNCSINTLTVDSIDGYTPTVQLENGTEINTLELKTAADITVNSGTTVDVLNVEASAPKSSVAGKGTLGEANINAARFVSEIIPAKYEIAKDINATFGNKTYSGSETDSDGFTKTPVLTSTTTADTIAYTPSQIGYLWYYYTNEANAPTNLSFSTYHTKATLKSKLTLASVKEYSTTLATNTEASSYKYIAVALSDASGNFYKPVLLTRSTVAGAYSANGLAAKPYITAGTTYDTLSYTSAVSGTLYFYYTNVSTAPDSNYFMTYYNAAVNPTYNVALYGSFSMTANVAANASLAINNSYTSGYSYVVIMLTTGNMSYTPIVISRADTASSGISGFATTPTVTTSVSGYDIFSVTPSYSGTVYYYYTSSSTAPSTQTFMSYYGINALYCGYQAFNASNYAQTLNSATFSTNATSNGFNYVVFMLKDNSNVSYTPVVVSRGTSSASSGFNVAPTITSNTNGYDYINFTPAYSGTVYFFYTSTNYSYTSTNFPTSYNNATATLKSYINVTAGTPISASLYASSSIYGYNYVVVCFKDSYNYYTPVTITRNSTSASGTGFSVAPTVISNAYGNLYLSGTPSVSGTLYYFASSYNTSYTASTFPTAYSSSTTSTGLKSYINVTANSAINSTSIGALNTTSYPYIIVCLKDNYGNYYNPVTIQVNGSTVSGATSGTGLYGTPTTTVSNSTDYITITPTVAGTLYYYYSTTNAVPTNFYSSFLNSSYRNTISVSYVNYAMNVMGQSASNVTSYPYIVLCMQYNNVFYTPVVITRNATSANATGFSVSPTLYTTIDSDYLSFSVPATGNVLYYYTTSSAAPTSNDFASYYSVSSYSGSLQCSTIGAYSNCRITSTINVTGYQYLVVMFIDANQVKYSPILISR